MEPRSETLTVRLSTRVKKELQRIAEADKRTASQYVSILIEEHLKALSAQRGKSGKAGE
jgi:predicted transcriptional regulator